MGDRSADWNVPHLLADAIIAVGDGAPPLTILEIHNIILPDEQVGPFMHRLCTALPELRQLKVHGPDAFWSAMCSMTTPFAFAHRLEKFEFVFQVANTQLGWEDSARVWDQLSGFSNLKHLTIRIPYYQA